MKTIDINKFINKTNFSNSFILGYYGAGNIGDELLLEVLLNRFHRLRYDKISFLYTSPKEYNRRHLQYENTQMVNGNKIIDIFKAILRSKNIIIGGGGIWGLDFNKNALFLSIILFISKFLLFKKVYLLGVGYVSSTTKLGHFGAFIASLSADIILARDRESYKLFASHRVNNVFLSDDLAFLIKSISINEYDDNFINQLVKLDSNKKYILLSFRGKKGIEHNIFFKNVDKLIKNNKDYEFVFLFFIPENNIIESLEVRDMQNIVKKYKNAQIAIIDVNPLSFFKFLKDNSDNLNCILMQFHGILMSKLAGCNFFPVSYDNKSFNLLKSFGYSDDEIISISNLTYDLINNYIHD